MDIHAEAVKLGVKIGAHESDMYLPVTPETSRLVEQYEFKGNVKMFTSQIDGKKWYDIPFAYQPYWDRVEGRKVTS